MRMSSAARFTWSNACLDNVPVFMLSCYLLGEGVNAELDKIRGRGMGSLSL